MTTIVARLYAAEEQAVGAADAATRRFGKDEITLVAPTSDKKIDIPAAIVKAGIRKAAAAAYAEKVRGGHWLVTIQAPWGFANDAAKILDGFAPVDAGVSTGEQLDKNPWHSAAPFSAWLGWPVLAPFKADHINLMNDATPYSKWARWPVLQPFKSKIALLNDAAPLSDKLGKPTLTDDKPFSTLAADSKGKASLIKNPTPFSEFFYLPVLMND